MIRRRVLARLAASLALLLPCLWHRHLVIDDLGSHTYNAWLAHLIRAGQAPGLHLARQYNNVLFDWLLDIATRLLGFGVGERLCVAAVLLLFFWGGFALVSAIAGNSGAWKAVPVLAMVAFGWTFQMGFCNYYLGLGLALCALAALLRGPRPGSQGSRQGLAVFFLLLPIIWLAHPISAAVAAGLGAYALVARRIPPRLQPFLFLACLAVLLVVREYLAYHFYVEWGSPNPLYLNGSDQLRLFGRRYALVAYAVLALMLSAFATDFLRNRRNLGARAMPVGLYLLSLMAVLWLPDFINLPGYAGPIQMITFRLTTVCAVMACAWFAAASPRAWQVAALAAAATVYFGMLYYDTGVLSRAEDAAVQLVAAAPGQRIVFIPSQAAYRGSRVAEMHLVDRACVGRCFSFSNYEPSSLQFRVRATEGNGIVTASVADSAAMELGTYVVRASDLPLLAIYQCGPAIDALCSRQLVAGERAGRGVY